MKLRPTSTDKFTLRYNISSEGDIRSSTDIIANVTPEQAKTEVQKFLDQTGLRLGHQTSHDFTELDMYISRQVEDEGDEFCEDFWFDPTTKDWYTTEISELIWAAFLPKHTEELNLENEEDRIILQREKNNLFKNLDYRFDYDHDNNGTKPLIDWERVERYLSTLTDEQITMLGAAVADYDQGEDYKRAKFLTDTEEGGYAADAVLQSIWTMFGS